MAATPSEYATAAVNEASRVAAEGARSYADLSRSYVDASRAAYDELLPVNRALFAAWTAGVEASLRTSFDLQNRVLEASQAVFEAAAAANREYLRQADDNVRRAQQTTVEGWQAGVRAAEKLVSASRPETIVTP
jgi:antirestriction protein ArdC